MPNSNTSWEGCQWECTKSAVRSVRCVSSSLSPSQRLPFQLELDLLALLATFMLDVDDRVGRNGDPLAGDLDAEGVAGFERVGKPAQFSDEAGAR